MLAFYRERLTNEGYLRTALDGRALREIAALVGYRRAARCGARRLTWPIPSMKSAAPVTTILQPAQKLRNDAAAPGEQNADLRNGCRRSMRASSGTCSCRARGKRRSSISTTRYCARRCHFRISRRPCGASAIAFCSCAARDRLHQVVREISAIRIDGALRAG